jgi:hypothetical protein
MGCVRFERGCAAVRTARGAHDERRALRVPFANRGQSRLGGLVTARVEQERAGADGGGSILRGARPAEIWQRLRDTSNSEGRGQRGRREQRRRQRPLAGRRGGADSELHRLAAGGRLWFAVILA